MNQGEGKREEAPRNDPPQEPQPYSPTAPEEPGKSEGLNRDTSGRILGFNRNVFYLGVVSLLNDAASEIIYPLVPLFLASIFATSFGIIIGVVEGIAEGTASLMKLFSGWYADRVKKSKAFVFIGYTLSVVIRPLIFLLRYIPSPYYLLFVRFFDRVGKGVRTAPRDALIAHSVSENERGKAFGFHRGMDHLGAVVGPLIAFGLIWIFSLGNPMNLSWIFLVALIPGIFSLYVIRSKVTEVAQEPAEVGDAEVQNDKTPKLTLVGFDNRFKLFLLILGLFSLGNSTDMFLLLRMGSIGQIGFRVALVWAAFHVVKSVLSTPAGMLSDWLGRKKVIIAGWVIYAIVYFGFAFVRGQETAWILFLMYGVYYALTEGVAKALVADYAPAEMRGTAFGWYHFVEGITLIPASIIFGSLLYAFQDTSAGVAVPFCFGAALALGAAVLLALFVPDKPEEEEPEQAVLPAATPVFGEEPPQETSGQQGVTTDWEQADVAEPDVEEDAGGPPESEPPPPSEPQNQPPEKNPYGNDPYKTGGN